FHTMKLCLNPGRKPEPERIVGLCFPSKSRTCAHSSKLRVPFHEWFGFHIFRFQSAQFDNVVLFLVSAGSRPVLQVLALCQRAKLGCDHAVSARAWNAADPASAAADGDAGPNAPARSRL